MLLHSSSLQYMQQAACASRCAPLVASAAKNVGNGASLDNLLNSATKKLKAFTPVKQTASNPASTQEKAVPAPEQRSRAVLAKQRQGQQPSTAQQKSSQQQQAKGGTPASISTPQQAAEELSPEDLNAWEIETALADIDAAVSSMPDGDIEEASSDDEDDGPSAFHRPAPRGFGSMSMQAAPLHAASRQASEGASTSGRGTSTYTGETTPASKDGIMRVFLYSSEETKAVEAIVELGLEGRLVLVRQPADADVVMAVKLNAAGKHVKLAQGERAALNAGVPFLVVGRNMSADTLLRALRTLRPDLVAHLGTSANEHQLQLEQARAQRVLEEGVPLVGVVGTKDKKAAQAPL